jgi:hypothetical protein
MFLWEASTKVDPSYVFRKGALVERAERNEFRPSQPKEVQGIRIVKVERFILSKRNSYPLPPRCSHRERILGVLLNGRNLMGKSKKLFAIACLLKLLPEGSELLSTDSLFSNRD